ncbi:hypothetical protein M409DRAFT_63743 [Zasmidium cellare ATCC 36951]|uniref:Major facilitator superfamily (MFS) profile domain-containing protein n=1 Tax=Zasmidium cellare ATCC 36951 TaxID=1080233 RepID=A0A6A6D092_ZASCE|nr:uncharacterized protein M409DRAFT_63743 [Zasmidium cellare ATCC 36951]KAF2171499.1 hypothetical protein M409DRAFT_63743 [Zasmidium cellare ATCC 36951]
MATTTTTTTVELQTLESNSKHVTINTHLPASTPSHEILSTSRAVLVIAQLIGLQLFSSFCNGIAVVGLPAIIDTVKLETGLLLWPTSVFYLTAGSCLMLAGSIADVVGTRPIILAANLLLIASAFACGGARTGGELIAFRGLQGVSFAMAVPASVSIISTNIAVGRPRNLGFSCLGFSSPLGFLLGLVLGGVMVDSVGWRPAFYLAGATTAALCVFGFWALPHDPRPARPMRTIWKQLALEIDWVGTMILSAGISILSYVLAMLSSDINNIRRASNIALLVISVATIPAFIWWMNYQVKHNRPAVMPNALWRNASFTSICIMVLLSNAVSNNMELFCSLFFQQVQGLSALDASIRILPALITAVLINISIGYFVNRLPIMLVVLTASAATALSPLLMAVIKPQWPYWYMAFTAQVFLQVCTNTLFTVGLLIISAVFPSRTQALGGAVFNTCAQLGTSIGLTVTQVITTTVTANSDEVNKSSPKALMDGYRIVFWALFAMMVLVGLTGALGLRRVGKIGVKQD